MITLAAAKLSKPTLQKIWDNLDDAEYYEFGDVVLLPFPFSNQTTKKRPAIVVSYINYQCERLYLILIAVTGQANLN